MGSGLDGGNPWGKQSKHAPRTQSHVVYRIRPLGSLPAEVCDANSVMRKATRNCFKFSQAPTRLFGLPFRIPTTRSCSLHSNGRQFSSILASRTSTHPRPCTTPPHPFDSPFSPPRSETNASGNQSLIRVLRNVKPFKYISSVLIVSPVLAFFRIYSHRSQPFRQSCL